MNYSSNFSDTAPLSYWGRVPVYATTWLVGAHCVFFVLTALAAPLGASDLIMGLVYSTQGILESFQIWQLATYAFVPLPLSFWFLVEMAMLYFFGQEVEKYLGRRVFLTLYALLILVPSFFLLVAGIFGTTSVLAGASAVHFAVFVAFAATAPSAQLLFGITAKWFALGFFVFNSLLLLAGQSWTPLFALWADVGTAVIFLRACGVHSLQFARFEKAETSWKKSSRKSPVEHEGIRSAILRSKQTRESREQPTRTDPLISIDPILEKISTKGIKSLTPAEKQRLEQARAELLEREKSRTAR